MEGYKVITAKEMARVEKESIDAGASGAVYMDKAGLGIAEAVIAFIEASGFPREVTLLVGKGNNGGDAFVAGCHLLEHGFTVHAIHLFSAEESSELCAKHRKRFEEKRGEVGNTLVFRGVILDGLLGTGFTGEAKGKIKEAIAAANATNCPKIAIDIPSGLDGNTGEGSAIKADLTLYLGMPKVGFFLGKGFNFIGKLQRVDFGLSDEYVQKMQERAFLVDEQEVEKKLPKIERVRHKYQTGYVVALAGSPGMGGAAELATLAALRAGAGIIRLFHPPEMEEELSGCFAELIRSHVSLDDTDKLFTEVKRARGLLIGPGLGTSEDHTPLIAKLLETGVPAVVDADGLSVFQSEVTHGEQLVLTPHHQEMVRLLGEKPSSLIEATQKFADAEKVVIVLKGAPTWIFSPGHKPLISVRGDPGMATAGTGDVLTGVIAALLAQGLLAKEAAVLGVHLHALAGEEAAHFLSSYSLIASDLIEYLPEVLSSLR